MVSCKRAINLEERRSMKEHHFSSSFYVFICLSPCFMSPLCVNSLHLKFTSYNKSLYYIQKRISFNVFSLFGPLSSSLYAFFVLTQSLGLSSGVEHKLSAHLRLQAKGHGLRPPTHSALGAAGISMRVSVSVFPRSCPSSRPTACMYLRWLTGVCLNLRTGVCVSGHALLRGEICADVCSSSAPTLTTEHRNLRSLLHAGQKPLFYVDKM
ncbi:hypothetical protein AMECASPLE_000833 [Ameca splendens]|uniref:Uncharacterized protein n=1 Tax=Ameca splendens TaxID=208324 RepID=A0ABV0ZUM9_9TELE